MEKKRPMPEVKSCIGLHMALKKYYKFWRKKVTYFRSGYIEF
jgi:hypothetical protein